MICTCQNCKSKLLLNKDQLRKRKEPIFTCPKCEALIKIKASKAKCGNCNKSFIYYDYKFALGELPLVKCNLCNSINKVKIQY